VIAIPREEQKVKTIVDLTKLRTAKFIISQQKNLRKSGRSSLSLLRIKTLKISIKITTFWWNSRKMKILTKV
jgi:hypothetical protein